MKFNGIKCEHCKNVFSENDDVVVCPQCGSPHHRECWIEKGECTNAHLHGEGFSWVFPEEMKPKEEKINIFKKSATPTDYQFKNGENAVICPHCNALNYGNDALCMKCRKPLNGETRKSSDNERPERYLDEENMYDYYERFGGLRPDIMIEGIPALEYADYIGEKKSGRFIRKFANMERFERKFSVSIPALLFGPVWFLYRKMLKEGIIYLLAILLLTGIQTYCSITESVKEFYTETGALLSEFTNGEISMEEFEERLKIIEEKQQTASSEGSGRVKYVISEIANATSLLINLAMAFLADYLYKKKIQADIMKIRQECNDMQTYRMTLRKRGGVSVGGMIIGIVCVGLIYFISMLPAYIIMFKSLYEPLL